MKCITRFPFGPQHVVLPEPIHFDLKIEDEVVVDVGFKLGFAHRGIERAFCNRDMYSCLFIAERICGICSFVHSCTVSGVLEKVCDLEIPDDAKYIRTLVLELERIHSHLLILGHLAETIGYENMFMLTWRDREMIMDMLEEITGNRVNHNLNTIGGVRRNVPSKMAKSIEKRLDDFKEKWDVLAQFYEKDSSFVKRTKGVGVISKDIAREAGIVGPNARGSGLKFDIRLKKYFAYEEVKFKPVVLEDGDIYARTMVRVKEVYESIRMCQEALSLINEKRPVAVERGPRKLPKNEVMFNTEAPRGELFYFVRGNGTNKPERMKVRTPTLATLRGVPVVLKGMEIQDVPATVISIDPCICCTER